MPLLKIGARVADAGELDIAGGPRGAAEHQLMAIYGWLTSKEAQRYTRATNRKRMADTAMGFLEGKEGPGLAHTGNQ
ncbi:hypothetical protein [Pyruvatibacter sp.]|uniref:hypothetical protein n=1 Tax=Pyruvatibacter sp. TaxID=1981328 RepID=UPI0032644F65